mmetsp:Transcript_51457/g.155892  ORF Transcript_51457/g.155892 Transcript_51457/m.155892 type:complete len:130 (+) Transcript_51457:120-509(+)
MQRVTLSVAALAVLATAAAATAVSHELRGGARFTIKDKVYVNGVMFAESSAINDNLGCHEHDGTSIFKVCGCGVKVIAHLLTECQTYQKYDEEIGNCDCGSDICDDKTLTSGYSEKFEWNAASFEIAPC